MSDPTPFLVFLGLLMQAQQPGPPPGPPGPPGPPTPFPDVPPPPGPWPSPAPVPDQPPPGPAPGPVVPPGQGPMPPMPPWPSPPTPGTLPPFPGPGWVPDIPVTPAVAARAAYWNPLLWSYTTRTIARPYVQEMLGGQWVTFAAAWHPGDSGPQTYMATEAWRLATAPPVAPPGPGPAPLPSGSAVQQAAAAMNAALAAHGYKQSDQPLYRAFQAAAGKTADGFPGTGTMASLQSVLSSMGQQMAAVKIYPWRSMPGMSGYDGKNAPTLAEWTGAAPAPAPAPAPPGVPNMQPPSNLTPQQQAAVAMNDALAAHGYKQHDMSLYKAFQTSAGLGADGFPGTHTMTVLAQVLHDLGVPIAAVPVYPWHSMPGMTGYNGTNAPTLAEWQG